MNASQHHEKALSSHTFKEGDVTGVLHFYSPPIDSSEPVFVVTDTSGAGIKNYSHNPKPMLIRDLRHRERDFTLPLHSFAAISGASAEEVDFSNLDDVQLRYGPIVEALVLQELPGVVKVVIFDMTIRKASPDEILRRPVRKVHIDQSPLGAYHRVRRHLSQADADQMVAGKLRVRIITIWKPLCGPVTDHPLAVAESATVKQQDLVRVKHVYPDVTGETIAVRYHPDQRFWYWSGMSTNEYLLMQCFDSLDHRDSFVAGGGTRCAHASFNLADPGQEGCARQSVEVRCLALG